jgi:hypothetical protein
VSFRQSPILTGVTRLLTATERPTILTHRIQLSPTSTNDRAIPNENQWSTISLYAMQQFVQLIQWSSSQSLSRMHTGHNSI